MRRVRILIASLFCGSVAHQIAAAATPDDLAHDLFEPSVNVIYVDTKISGPEGAITPFSRKDSEIKAGSSSGVSLKTGGSASPTAPGDDQLSKAIGKETVEAASMTVNFRPTAPRKTIRLNVTLLSEETAERLQKGFDDVFAASLDGRIITFVRAADTKEPGRHQKSDNPKTPRMVNVSSELDLSEARLHELKISIASVGDGGGPSTAIVSVDGEPGVGSSPSTSPPDPHEIPRKGTYPPSPPVISAPPPPSIIFEGANPAPVPDRSSSFAVLLIGCAFLVFFGYSKKRLKM